MSNISFWCMKLFNHQAVHVPYVHLLHPSATDTPRWQHHVFFEAPYQSTSNDHKIGNTLRTLSNPKIWVAELLSTFGHSGFSSMDSPHLEVEIATRNLQLTPWYCWCFNIFRLSAATVIQSILAMKPYGTMADSAVISTAWAGCLSLTVWHVWLYLSKMYKSNEVTWRCLSFQLLKLPQETKHFPPETTSIQIWGTLPWSMLARSFSFSGCAIICIPHINITNRWITWICLRWFTLVERKKNTK